jgi:hypothetical protein
LKIEAPVFPHPTSAWWIPILLALGWGPLSVADLFYPQDWKVAEGFGMGWGMGGAFPGTTLAALSVPIQAFRLLMYFLNRPKPISK